MNSISFFLSLLMHMGLVLVVLVWPATPPYKPPTQVYQVSLVMGAPGGENLPSPVLGARALPADKPNASLAQPVPVEKVAESTPAVAEAPALDLPPPTPQASQAPAANSVPPPPVPVAPRDAALPQVPKPEVVTQRREDPPPAPPKAKPAPEPPATKPVQEPPKAKPVPEPAKAEAPKAEPPKTETPKPPKAEAPKRDVLADALSSAKKDAGKPATTNRDGGARRSSAANALADLQKQTGVGGGGGQGDGPGGGGIYDVYGGQIMRMVQPNWSIPIYSRENITVQLRIVVDSQGNVQECTVARSSGRAEFDASAQNAVIRTAILPPPPSPDYQEIFINFNSLEAMGR